MLAASLLSQQHADSVRASIISHTCCWPRIQDRFRKDIIYTYRRICENYTMCTVQILLSLDNFPDERLVHIIVHFYLPLSLSHSFLFEFERMNLIFRKCIYLCFLISKEFIRISLYTCR